MKIKLYIVGSLVFYNLLKELNIFDVEYCNDERGFSDEDSPNFQKIILIFPETLKLNIVKKIFLKKLPSIYFIIDQNFFLSNKIILSNYELKIKIPFEFTSFVEIIKILSLKYSFFKNSHIILKNNYVLDSNQRIISKGEKKIKLTEKELKIIIYLNKSDSLSKQDLLMLAWNQNIELDSHAFETNLHRIRKKMIKVFNDKTFILEKNSRYFL